MTDQLVDSPDLVPNSGTALDEPSEAKGRKRQWGSERRSEPLPIVHPKPSARKIVLGRLAILVTVGAWMYYVVSTIIREFINNPNPGFRFTIESVSYVVVVTGSSHLRV